MDSKILRLLTVLIIDMSRPECPRRIAHKAPADYYKPAGIPLCDLDEILLGADELEAIRLGDLQGLYHVEAAEHMRVSRQTFDRILRKAHVKVATALVNGMALRISHESKKKK